MLKVICDNENTIIQKGFNKMRFRLFLDFKFFCRLFRAGTIKQEKGLSCFISNHLLC